MNVVERACITIRHSPGLAKAGWLWNAARPAYDAVVNTFGRHGLTRVMNGTDRLLIDAKHRGLREAYEPEVWGHLMANVMRGDVIADIGAHIGLYTVALAQRVAPNGQVVAFEPDERSFGDLVRHVELNGLQRVVQPVKAAVSTVVGEIGFTRDHEMQNRILVERTTEASIVPSVRLDSFFKGRRVDILKVDVEGFEEEVLRGGRELLADPRSGPRLIYLEVHPYNWDLCGTTSESLLGHLREAGYDVETPDGTPCTNISTYGEIVALRTRCRDIH